MIRLTGLLFASLLALAACGTSGSNEVDADGRAVQGIYRISNSDKDKVQFRMLDSINALRQSAGHQPLVFDRQLNAAAATHARDMSVQNRPWHFGSDGSSPLDRVARTGYPGKLLGENISETYETEVETLAAWMKKPDTRNVILAPEARNLGFEWHQERNGKIWWTLVTGT